MTRRFTVNSVARIPRKISRMGRRMRRAIDSATGQNPGTDGKIT
jgi:hypothetical protein